MSKETLNIYQKLIEVRKEVPYLKKEKQGHQYNFVGSSQVLGTLKFKMDELGLLLIPTVTSTKVSIDQYEKNGKRTTDYFTEIEVDFTWVNAEKPDETIKCHWYGQGLDTAGEKGVGKALTYAEKYFMLKFFNIPTDKDDSDSFQKKYSDHEEQEPQKQKTDKPQQIPDLINNEQVLELIELAKQKGIEESKICSTYKVNNLCDMTSKQFEHSKAYLTKLKAS